MEWTRSETLALAFDACTQCFGMGVRSLRGGRVKPCSCVLRSIFRACYARFRTTVEKQRNLSLENLDGTYRGGCRHSWGRKNEEYMADFYLVTRRALSKSDWKLFSARYLLGANWRLCTRQFNMDRGQYFHAIYRIEARLGLVYRTLAPYPLFPTDEYFLGVTGSESDEAPPEVVEMPRVSLHDRLNVPIRKAA
ncbi:MAG: hypothetical protein QM757_12510 [Paludibaculum sp.]